MNLLFYALPTSPIKIKYYTTINLMVGIALIDYEVTESGYILNVANVSNITDHIDHQ